MGRLAISSYLSLDNQEVENAVVVCQEGPRRFAGPFQVMPNAFCIIAVKMVRTCLHLAYHIPAAASRCLRVSCSRL